MLAKIFFLITFCPILLFAQEEDETLLSIRPVFGLGIALPSKVNISSGNEKLSYVPSLRILGNLASSTGAVTNFSFKMTNQIGFVLDYHVNLKRTIGISFTRNTQIDSYVNPFEFEFAKGKLRNWYGYVSYYNISVVPRHKWKNKNGTNIFADLGLSYSTNFNTVLNRRTPQEVVTGNFVENGTGVLIEAFAGRKSTFILSPEIGYRAHESRPFDISFGVTIPLQPMYTERYYFYKDNKITGVNLKNLNQSVILIKAHYNFELVKKKPKLPKEPKIRESKTKPSPIITKKEKVNFGDKKIEEGEKIILKNIQFEQTKWMLNPSAMGELDRLVELMKTYPKMRIEITGHTSSEGDRNDNIELSRKRAESCKDYLRKNGIESNRIITRGIGPDSPISNTDKSLNRRVEFSVIKVN